jgi:hypothetical protein
LLEWLSALASFEASAIAAAAHASLRGLPKECPHAFFFRREFGLGFGHLFAFEFEGDLQGLLPLAALVVVSAILRDLLVSHLEMQPVIFVGHGQFPELGFRLNPRLVGLLLGRIVRVTGRVKFLSGQYYALEMSRISQRPRNRLQRRQSTQRGFQRYFLAFQLVDHHAALLSPSETLAEQVPHLRANRTVLTPRNPLNRLAHLAVRRDGDLRRLIGFHV